MNTPNCLNKWWQALDPQDEKTAVYGAQKKFEALFSQTVRQLENAIKETEGRSDRLTFHQLFRLSGKLRHQMAVEMESADKEEFGKLRHTPVSYTPACNTYLIPHEEWNQTMLMRLLTLETSNSHKITRSHLAVYKTDSLKELMRQTDNLVKKRESERVQYNADLLNCLSGIHQFIGSMRIPGVKLGSFPDCGNISFKVETIEVKVLDYWSLSSRNITWICEDNSQNIFKEWAWATILHTPSSNVFEQLEAAAMVFDNLMKEPSEDLFHELEYRLFHAMPFFRGSAASIELFMCALANHLGIERDKPSDKEAFSKLL